MNHPLRYAVAFVLMISPIVAGDILIVDPSDPSAYSTVDDAVNDAFDGDTVRIAAGTYDEVGLITVLNRDITVESLSGDPADTIIRNATPNAGSVIQVLGATGQLALNNLTIQDGMASNGGGLAVASGAYAVVNNCIFRNNFSTFLGGGIYVDDQSSLYIATSSFIGNTCNGSGGGLLVQSTRVPGEPTSGYTIDRCTFLGNVAEFGGGAYLGDPDSTSSGPTPEISNCLFSGNEAGSLGGGLIMVPVQNPEIPIVASAEVRSCTFSGNTAQLDPAVRLEPGGDAGVEGISVRNSIVWANNGPRSNPLDDVGNLLSYAYCCVDFLPDLPSGLDTSCVGIDPRFQDALGKDGVAGTEDDDLRVEPGSPVIDRGNNTYVGIFDFLDVGGNTRQLDDPTVVDRGEGEAPIIDIGAHEFSIADISGSTNIWYGAENTTLKDLDNPANWWGGSLPGFSGSTLMFGNVDGDDIERIRLAENESLPTLAISRGEWQFSSLGEQRRLNVTSGLGLRGGVSIAPYTSDALSELRLNGADLDCSGVTVNNWGSLWLNDATLSIGNSVRLIGGQASLSGQGTINQDGFGVLPALANGGVINLAGDLTIDGRYEQFVTVDDETIFGMVSVNTAILDTGATIAIDGAADLGGAFEFTIGQVTPDTGTTYTLMTSSIGFGVGPEASYVVCSGFNDGRFITLAVADNVAGTGESLVATVQSAEALLLPGSTADTTDATVEDMILADVSNPPDGYSDLILSVRDSSAGAGYVVILLNNGVNGSGDWQDFDDYDDKVIITVCDEPSGLDAGDVDGDGLTDIVLACTDTGEVWLLTNNSTPLGSTPTFTSSSTASAPHLPLADQPNAQPVDVWVGNLDKDVKPDIAVTNLFDGSVVAFKNELPDLLEGPGGMGGFDGEDNDSYPENTLSKLDPNAGGGGGRDDEIWGSSKNGDTTSKGSSGGSGLGGGSLQLVWGNYSTGQGPEDLAVGDLDMDGAKDVITADQDGDTFSILLGDGSGGLGSSISFDLGAGAEPRSIDCGDLDGDGDIDIAIICDDTNGDRVLRVYENTLISGGTAGTYGFTSTSDLLTILGATIVRLDDVDNDGIDDTLTATSPASPLVGGTNSELEFLVSNQGRGKPTCVGDLNDDGSINGADLGLLIAGWGPCVDEDCIGDLNEDGTVNGADLGLMIASWGPCTVNQ